MKSCNNPRSWLRHLSGSSPLVEYILKEITPQNTRKCLFLPLSGETGARVAEVAMLDFLITPYPSCISLTHALFCHKYSLIVLLSTLCLNACLHSHSSLSCTSYLCYFWSINKNTDLKLAFIRSWCFFLVKKIIILFQNGCCFPLPPATLMLRHV